MDSLDSLLGREARQAAEGAQAQLTTCAPLLGELARRLRLSPPSLVITCARGSSDHAATYGKYVLETRTGHIVASVGPSVASMYQRAPVGLASALFITVSQSGRSPDVLQLTESAKRGGALVVGIINDTSSPLAALCDIVLPLCAGEERAVAATKSYLLSALAFLQLAAAWTGDAALVDAAARAPDAFNDACDVTWDLSPLATAHSAYVVGRGIGLGAAQELALKLKETCRLHAEAFSSAEILHGPVELVGAGFPIIAIEQADETAQTTRNVLAQLASLGAAVQRCPGVAAPSVLAPLCQVQSFYIALPALAAARGLDADRPAHLAKVTKTI
jgi:glucosamine--fructose-6-phosphate aminotransferase (isomerizing)